MPASVSVVIPCYRCADTLPRAVASVAAQSLRPAEMILVDDGSDDGTCEAIGALEKQYGADWISVIRLSRNAGVSAARNTGWDAAMGDYVAFLDADDAWHPSKIALQYGWMREHPEVAVSAHRSIYLEPHAPLPAPNVQETCPASQITKNRLLRSNPFVTPAVMLKRNLPYRFDSQKRYCEDYLLWLQIVLDGHKIFLLDAELAYVFKRIGKTGASSHLLKMRYGDITNYWQLWKSKRLDVFRASALTIYSLMKFVVMLALGPQRHYAVKQRVESHWR
jgi:glycosyltransferase involved in cell wall biosynthesis